MTKAQDFSEYLLRRVDTHGEYFTVKATGHSGMSYRGLARFIGKHHSAVGRWVNRVKESDLAQNDLPKCFKSFAGKSLTLDQYHDPEGREILVDLFCSAIITYFASEAPSDQRTEKAVQADKLIRQVGIRQLIHLRTGWKPAPNPDDFETAYIRQKQRLNTRVALKDIFRVELMDAIRDWRKNHKASRKVFWEAQDAANKRLQGLKSQEIKTKNGMSKSSLIRDYFDAEPLIDYSAINRLAANLIIRQDLNPVDAVNQACDLYLKPNYQPKPVQLLENVYKADLKLEKQRKRLKFNSPSIDTSNGQLALF